MAYYYMAGGDSPITLGKVTWSHRKMSSFERK